MTSGVELGSEAGEGSVATSGSGNSVVRTTRLTTAVSWLDGDSLCVSSALGSASAKGASVDSVWSGVEGLGLGVSSTVAVVGLGLGGVGRTPSTHTGNVSGSSAATAEPQEEDKPRPMAEGASRSAAAAITRLDLRETPV